MPIVTKVAKKSKVTKPAPKGKAKSAPKAAKTTKKATAAAKGTFTLIAIAAKAGISQPSVRKYTPLIDPSHLDTSGARVRYKTSAVAEFKRLKAEGEGRRGKYDRTKKARVRKMGTKRAVKKGRK